MKKDIISSKTIQNYFNYKLLLLIVYLEGFS